MINTHHDLRRRMGALIVDNMFRGMARAGRLHPLSRPERHNVEILRDIPYRTDIIPSLRLKLPSVNIAVTPPRGMR